MKKLTAILLSAVLALSVAGCSNSNSASNTDTAASTKAPETEAASTEGTDTASAGTDSEAGSKTLVVYYSASGNTERVAKEIAEAAGADLFEIVPEEEYTSDDLNWRDSDSRVSREHEDEALQDVALTTTEVPNWDSYDTVLIGYPIWWGIAAWPVDGFVKANDFTGKTVIPFATSSSSGIGESGTLLEKMAGTGDWQEGQRFSSGVSASDVQDWVSELGL